MAIFKTCCCCISLRTGCIIIGVLEILAQIWNISVQKQVTGSVIGGTLIAFVVSALLIYGAAKRNRVFLWPWIVVSIITLIILVIGLLLCVFASALIVDVFKAAESEGKLSDEEMEQAQIGLTTLVVLIAVSILIAIAILIPLTLVVYSYVCELREEEVRQNNNTNAPPKAYNLVPV